MALWPSTPTSHLMAQILPMMWNAARCSRPRLAIGVLRALCNGMCRAQRFHMDGEEQRCRAGCRDESDSLTLQRTTSSPLPGVEAICFTTSSLKSPQEGSNMGSLVMGMIDAFVYSHNRHRRNLDLGSSHFQPNPVPCSQDLLVFLP